MIIGAHSATEQLRFVNVIPYRLIAGLFLSIFPEALSSSANMFAEGIAAGAMLTMIAAAMIPEAAAHGKPSAIGPSTLAGFLAAVLFKLVE